MKISSMFVWSLISWRFILGRIRNWLKKCWEADRSRDNSRKTCNISRFLFVAHSSKNTKESWWDLYPKWELIRCVVMCMNFLSFMSWECCKSIKVQCSEKATTFCEISTLLLSYVVRVKSKVMTLQSFVAFSEYMNFRIEKQIF